MKIPRYETHGNPSPLKPATGTKSAQFGCMGSACPCCAWQASPGALLEPNFISRVSPQWIFSREGGNNAHYNNTDHYSHSGVDRYFPDLAACQKLGLRSFWSARRRTGGLSDTAADGSYLTSVSTNPTTFGIDVKKEFSKMMRGVLLWLIGLPLPIILILWLLGYLS
jgi:hypothetical protein